MLDAVAKIPAGAAALIIAAGLHCAAGKGDEPSGAAVAERFRMLSRSSRWALKESIRLQFDTFHPQGMTRVGDRFFLSSVETKNRLLGAGIGHLFEFDSTGKPLRQTRLGEKAMYHPGGIDWDGECIWVPVAEYRPDSRSVVYRVDPQSLSAEKLFAFPDHLGAIVHCRHLNALLAVSWGSRRIYAWKTAVADGRRIALEPDKPAMHLNGSHYVDYQDLQSLPGTPYVLCGGLAGYRPAEASSASGRAGFTLGGIEMLDVSGGLPVHQIPIALFSARGRVMTQNPFYIEASGAGLRAYFIPDDNDSTMYVYEVAP